MAAKISLQTERRPSREIDLDGAVTVQNAGKHGDTLFGEGVGWRADATPT